MTNTTADTDLMEMVPVTHIITFPTVQMLSAQRMQNMDGKLVKAKKKKSIVRKVTLSVFSTHTTTGHHELSICARIPERMTAVKRRVMQRAAIPSTLPLPFFDLK